MLPHQLPLIIQRWNLFPPLLKSSVLYRMFGLIALRLSTVREADVVQILFQLSASCQLGT